MQQVATWGRPLLCISLLSVAACSSSETKAAVPSTAPASSTTTTAPRPTTTTTVPLYSFDNSVPPPKLVNTGNDYKRILRSLLEYEAWIAAYRP